MSDEQPTRLHRIGWETPDQLNEQMIRAVVEQFYADARNDPIIGPVFNRVIAPQAWPHHIDLITDFWSSMLLGTGRYVTSGKVYEYMASALPIVSVHDPGNAASDVLRGYPLWFPAADLSPDSVATALVAGAAAARSADRATREACARHAAGFTRVAQLRPRVEALLG